MVDCLDEAPMEDEKSNIAREKQEANDTGVMWGNVEDLMAGEAYIEE